MLKKNEVLEILENGGHININEIYRTAYVYPADCSDFIDCCRYDTAQRIEKTAGYISTRGESWSFTRRIKKEPAQVEEIAQAMEQAAATVEAVEEIQETQEQPENLVCVGDPDTMEILTGSPRAVYYAILSRVRAARWNQEDSPDWFPLTDNAARIIQAAHAVAGGRSHAAALARATVRGYRNQRTQEQTQAAAVAMGWYRSGDAVTVSRYLDAHVTKYTTVRGARVEKPARDENRDYCRRVADEIDSYAAGDVARCPNCGEIHARPWDEVGDVFRCPHCGDVADVEEWETLTVWDYLADVLDYEYIVASTRELQAVRVYVTLGGPTCWIDTERRTVELRWGGESACYGLLSDTVDAVEEWARDMWEMGV